MKETIILLFEKDGDAFTYNWVIKKGFRGIRDANKVRKLQREWGDPVEIIGDGQLAKLLRREYQLYHQNRENYKGIPTRDILKAGAQITGVPVERLQKTFRKIVRKVRK